MHSCRPKINVCRVPLLNHAKRIGQTVKYWYYYSVVIMLAQIFPCFSIIINSTVSHSPIGKRRAHICTCLNKSTSPMVFHCQLVCRMRIHFFQLYVFGKTHKRRIRLQHKSCVLFGFRLFHYVFEQCYRLLVLPSCIENICKVQTVFYTIVFFPAQIIQAVSPIQIIVCLIMFAQLLKIVPIVTHVFAMFIVSSTFSK